MFALQMGLQNSLPGFHRCDREEHFVLILVAILWLLLYLKLSIFTFVLVLDILLSVNHLLIYLAHLACFVLFWFGSFRYWFAGAFICSRCHSSFRILYFLPSTTCLLTVGHFLTNKFKLFSFSYLIHALFWVVDFMY